MIKYYKGNLILLALKGHFDVIAHGCNCQCGFGRGIAKDIKTSFPEAYTADLKTIKGDITKLGSYSFAKRDIKLSNLNVVKTLFIVNLYTQYRWSWVRKELNENALRNCFKALKKDFSGKKIAMPLIGAGLAKGTWKEIESIINEELIYEDINIIIYNKEE